MPIEIRRCIYDLLLVSRFDRERNPSWAVGDSYQKQVRLSMIQHSQYRTMEPGILRVCRKIYSESKTILYTDNMFNVTEPEQMFRFLAQIGHSNIKSVRSLDIWVPWLADIGPWLKLLTNLAGKGKGLRFIKLGWDIKHDFPWELVQGAKERGLGDNLQFVRALGQIQGLETLVIEGYYAKRWPAYLEKKMEVKVQARCGHYLELRNGDLNEEQLEDEQFKRQLNEEELKSFTEYQQGTENLIP